MTIVPSRTILRGRVARRDLLTTTMLAGLALSPPTCAFAQDVGPTGGGGSVTLPTVDVDGAGSGLGGRFTGYSPDLDKPAAASKSNIPLLQTPASIQIVPREVMDDQQAITVQESLLNNISSVSLGNQFYDDFIIRGLKTEGATFRNNLRQTSITKLETANLQAIEVLKGPAAMLYGRVEPGGLVNLVVKRPLLVPYVSVQEQAGSFGFTRTTVDATGPLTPDNVWLYRINGAYLHTDSFRNFVTNQNGFVAPTITYSPIQQFRFNLDFEYQTTSFVDDGQALVAVGKRPAPIPISRYLQDPTITVPHPNRQQRLFTGFDWTYDLSENWSLVNRFGYTNVYYRQAIPFPAALCETGNPDLEESCAGDPPLAAGTLQRGLWYIPDANRQTTAANLDLKGKFYTGPLQHDVLVGSDYYQYYEKFSGLCCDDTFVGPINIYNPNYVRKGGDGFLTAPENFFYVNEQNWKGIYAQDQISFADDRLHILLGGRYDWARYGQSNFDGVSGGLNAAKATLMAINTNAFSPRIGAVVQPAPWLSFYGSYSESFGANNGFSPEGRPFAPQRGRQYEGGVKAEFFDGRLTATMAYYDIFKTNVPQPIPGTVFSVPVGEAESKGVEIDIAGRIDENWSLIGSYSHDDARITKDNDADGTFGNTGNRLASVPLNAGNIWVKYNFLDDWRGLSLGGGVVVVGQRQGDNANTFQLPAYARVDLAAIYRLPFAGPAITAQLNIKNLLGTTYYESSNDRLTIAPGAPRVFLASIRAEF
jgi:iron complex outermembrane receptor protein